MLQPVAHHPRGALAGFQHRVADKCVGNDHVGNVREQIVSIDVANEIQVRLLQQPMGFQGQFVAFHVLRAYGEHGHARVLVLQNLLRVQTGHHRVLHQVFGCGSRFTPTSISTNTLSGAGINTARPGRSTPSSVRSLSSAAVINAPVLPAETIGVCLALFDEVDGAAHRAVFLAPHRLHGRIVHLDDLAGVDNFDAGVRQPVLAQFRFDPRLVANQNRDAKCGRCCAALPPRPRRGFAGAKSPPIASTAIFMIRRYAALTDTTCRPL